MLDLTPEQHELLVELLEFERKELLHQLHHTDARSFQRLLRQRIEVVEAIAAKARVPYELATA